MVQRQITVTTDDMDGSEISEGDGAAVRFSIDGQYYAIDLSNSNRQLLEDALEPFIAAARRMRPTRQDPGTPTTRLGGSRASAGDAKRVRAWAAAQGLDVPARGRIPQRIREAYKSVH